MKFHKKWAKWLCIIVGLGSVGYIFFSREQASGAASQTITNVGSNSSAANLSVGTSGSNSPVQTTMGSGSPAQNTSGNNSPTIIQSATTGNNSPVTQIGTANLYLQQNISITNIGSPSAPALKARFLTNNMPVNGMFASQILVHIDSPFTVGMLYVAVYGQSIRSVTEAPTDGSMLMVQNGMVGDHWVTKNPNAHGDLEIMVFSEKPETNLWVEYYIQ